ncbi:MAG TPA: hypothetical protein VNL16_08250 [Chloroflexota bacterium]|nr:hypothetical protein [Chloroflexota bacterium]
MKDWLAAIGQRVVAAIALLGAFAGALTLVALYLNQEFDRARGPVRGTSPAVVIVGSAAAVVVVLVLWLAAATSGARGANGGEE